LLLQSGANVDILGKDGKTVLHFAVEKGQDKFVQLLLEYRPNVNTQDKDGKTVLHCAVQRRKEKFVQLLLKCRPNVNTQDKDSKTVLHVAVEIGCSQIFEHVLKHCPAVNNNSNRSALNVAVHGNGRQYGKIVKNLLQYGFTVRSEYVNNYEMLHAAVQKRYFDNY